LYEAVERFNKVHQDWVDDPNTENPTLAYWDAFDALIDTFRNGDLPSCCRRLATAVFELGVAGEDHHRSDRVVVAQAFWAAREHVEQLMDRIKRGAMKPYHESVQYLDREKVPHEQIARMWGLVNADGSGNSRLVLQELERPGSVIGPDYVHPDDVEPDGEMLVAQAKYQQLRAARDLATQAAKEEERPCPETSEQLWLEKVGVEQAARMLKRPLEDVVKEWKGFEQERIARKAVKPEKAEERTVEDVSRYRQFEDWNFDDLKRRAKQLGISITGQQGRTVLIDKILEAERLMPAEEVAK
jgi:hypothetical protein